MQFGFALRNSAVTVFFAIMAIHLSSTPAEAQYEYIFNPASYSHIFESHGDRHTVGSILQPQGGRVRRYDGNNDFFGNYNAYNNPSAYPPAPQFGTGQLGFFGRR